MTATKVTSSGALVHLRAPLTIGALELMPARIIVDHPDAPAEFRNIEVGRVIGPHLQLPEQEWGMSVEVLRAIADLIEEARRGDIEPEPDAVTD